jgi:hypothetical protein
MTTKMSIAMAQPTALQIIIRRRPNVSTGTGKTQQPARIREEKSERPISAYISRISTLFHHAHLPKFDHRWLPTL